MWSAGGAVGTCDLSTFERTPCIGYTLGMKVAVSIPDSIFQEAEELARQLGTSRSEIYARALAAFTAAHASDRVTEALDAAVATAGDGATGAFSQEAARRALRRAEW